MRTDAAPANPNLHQLAAAQRRVNIHEDATRQARDARDRLIATLREQGVPWQEISETTGISPRGLSKAISGR